MHDPLPNFRSEETLNTFLKENGIIGIEGIDTRNLTRILRESGVYERCHYHRV